MKLQGVPFCKGCACEQETYFAIGEFTEADDDASGKSFAVIVDLVKKVRVRSQAVRVSDSDAA